MHLSYVNVYVGVAADRKSYWTVKECFEKGERMVDDQMQRKYGRDGHQ